MTRANLRLVDAPPLTEAGGDRLIDSIRSLVQRDADASKSGLSDRFWSHDTTVMGWREQDEPAPVSS